MTSSSRLTRRHRHQKMGRRKRWRRVGSAVLAILAVLGGVGTYFQLAPYVTVTSTQPIRDPKDPFSAFFTIENGGVLSIYEVQRGCSYPKINFDGRWELTGNPEAFIGNPPLQLPSLPPKVPRSFECRPIFGIRAGKRPLPVVGTQMVILVTYKPLPVWWGLVERRFAFETVTNPDGLLQWVPLHVDRVFTDRRR